MTSVRGGNSQTSRISIKDSLDTLTGLFCPAGSPVVKLIGCQGQLGDRRIWQSDNTNKSVNRPFAFVLDDGLAAVCNADALMSCSSRFRPASSKAVSLCLPSWSSRHSFTHVLSVVCISLRRLGRLSGSMLWCHGVRRRSIFINPCAKNERKLTGTSASRLIARTDS